MLRMSRSAVIILNWNSLEVTLECVAMVKAWALPFLDVIIVDNASSTPQREQLAAMEASDVTVLLNDANLGYAGGNNRGIRYACEHGYNTILLLNSDAEIQKESVLILYDALARFPEAGVVGPLIYDENYEVLQNAGGLDIAFHDITHLKSPRHTLEPYVVDYVSGTVFLARAEMFQCYGLLDEDYFFSGEIADFCYRCKSNSMIHPGARASHNTRHSGRYRATLYTYYTVRNRYLYIRKNMSARKWNCYALWWNTHARHALTALRSGGWAEAGMVMRGVLDGMRNKIGAIG
ncbi:glycosyltransferase [Pseudomonadota bacterium]